MTVAELLKVLQEVPNPSVTDVTLDGVAIDAIDSEGVVSGGIDLDDGGAIDLQVAAG